jgi:DNA-binding CsgD family transcriptional regulator
MTTIADTASFKLTDCIEMSRHLALMTTIDKLYAAALDPAEWLSFLATAASLLKADNAFISQMKDARRPFDYFGLDESKRGSIPVSRFEDVAAHDPRMAIFHGVSGRPVHCRMATTQKRLHASRAYREYLEPLGIEYSMITALPLGSGLTHTLGFTRGKAGKAFNQNDLDLLGELSPHLQRAFTIRRTLVEHGKVPEVLPPQEATRRSDHEFLQRVLAISPAQTRLALVLINGRTVKQAALDLGLKESSARQYLKLIFEKTGARRQADLVRLVEQTLKQND